MFLVTLQAQDVLVVADAAATADYRAEVGPSTKLGMALMGMGTCATHGETSFVLSINAY
jgi:hypothetical protein